MGKAISKEELKIMFRILVLLLWSIVEPVLTVEASQPDDAAVKIEIRGSMAFPLSIGRLASSGAASTNTGIISWRWDEVVPEGISLPL